MTRAIEISHQGRVSRFVLQPVERKILHGFKRRIALDEQGNECALARLSRDGRFMLSAGSTAETYLDANGNGIKRSDLVMVDADGKSLPILPATMGRPQAVEGPVALDNFLGYVVTRVYVLEAEALDPALEKNLRDGAIFRIPYRPRSSHSDTPAFLLADEYGVFIVQVEPCNFDFVGMEQTVSDVDALDESDAGFNENDEFTFDLEIDHAVA